MIIPAGITFSALSVIIDDITQRDEANRFEFSFYQTVKLFEADEDNPLQSENWQYDAREASSTFIDDYFEPKKRLSFATPFFFAAIEVEKEGEQADFTAPVIVKTSFSSDCDWLNEHLRRRFELVSGEPGFIKKDEINRLVSKSRKLMCSPQPKSDPENTAWSASG